MFKGDNIKTELFSINKTIFESFVKLELFISPFKKLLNVNNNDFFLIKKGSINLPNYEFKTGEELELFNNIEKKLINSKLNKLKFKLNTINFLKINYIAVVDANFFLF